MPKPSKLYLDPNFDPKINVLPEIPEEIKTYKRNLFNRRRWFLIFIFILGFAVIAGFIVFSLKNNASRYQYIKIISQYTASSNDKSPGPDIESIEIKLNNLTYYSESIAATSENFSKQANNNYKDADKLLGAPITENNTDYVSLGSINNYVVVKTDIDLKDPNIDAITINEISADTLAEAYDVFIGTSKKGPWDYAGRFAGTASIIF